MVGCCKRWNEKRSEEKLRRVKDREEKLRW